MEYGGNTVFYGKAAGSTLTLKDVFSDVLKPHSKADGERIFLAGTSQSTPSEQEMLAQWKKPWLFLRVAVIGIVLAIGAFLPILLYGNTNMLPAYFILAAGTLPVAVLIFFWEMNIPRNIPIYEVILMLFAGGVLALCLALALDDLIPALASSAPCAAFIEEPAKILALALFLRKPGKKYILNGILIGAAVGAGFALFESAGYIMNCSQNIDQLRDMALTRGFANLGGHALYASIEGGALALVKGFGPLKSKHFFSGDFLKFAAAPIVCHFLNNSAWFPSLGIGELDLPRLLLNLLLWAVMLRLLQKGIRQVLAVSSAVGPAKIPAAAAMPAAVPASAAGSYTVSGVAGLYRGQTVPVGDGNLVFGRDPTTCNLIFPASTAGISRLHCILKKRGGELLLTDCNSSCGTFLENGTRLVSGEETRLELGQRFYLGSRETMFEVTLGANRHGL